MRTVFFDIDDDVLRQSFEEIFAVFGFQIVEKMPADFVFCDVGDRVVVNENMVFEKPVDIFSMISKLSESTNVERNGVLLNLREKLVSFGKNFVALTDVEVKILSYLMAEEDGVLANDLAIAVFSNVSESNLKSLATHIYNLRKKLEKITGKQKNIVLENSRYFFDV